MFPGREISIGVQRALQLVIGRRAIKIVLHVVFAGPQNHDRFARSFGNLRRLHDEIRLIAAPKAAAHQHRMHDHFFRGQLRSFRNNALRPLGRLRRNPRFRAVGTNVHGAIHRFHASVRGERKLVGGFDFLRTGREGGVRIAIVAYDFSSLGGIREELFVKSRGRFLRCRAFLPFHCERIAALDRGPGIVRQHGDSAGGRSASSAGFKLNDIVDAGKRFRFRGVKRGDFAAEDRTPRDHRVKHAGNARVDSEFGGPSGFTHDGEIVRVLEWNSVEIGNGKL